MSLADHLGRPYTGKNFCVVVARDYLAEQGIPFPDVARPADAAAWVRVERPQPNDAVVFNILGRPAHVGVCLGRDRFLHCEEGRASGVERLSSPLWGARIEGYYRWVG